MKRLVLVSLIFLTSVLCWADPTLTTTNLITELMMNGQINDASMMALFFGTDPSSQVAFTTFVDSANLSFSYSSQPGSTYLGQDLSLSGAGVFDQSTGVMSLTSSGMLGSTPWSTSGQFFVTGDSSGYQFTGQESLFPGFGSLPPSRCIFYEVNGAKVNDDGTSVAGGTWFNECTKRNGFWQGEDLYIFVDGGIDMETTEFGETKTTQIRERGKSPPKGGSGNNFITYSIVPEPSSILLLGLGVLGVAVATRYRYFSLPRGLPNRPYLR